MKHLQKQLGRDFCQADLEKGERVIADIREITSGLLCPEGPVAMDDGSVIVTELQTGRLVRVQPDGAKDVVAELGGSANGAAVGPDGMLYGCNNGGLKLT